MLTVNRAAWSASLFPFQDWQPIQAVQEYSQCLHQLQELLTWEAERDLYSMHRYWHYAAKGWQVRVELENYFMGTCVEFASAHISSTTCLHCDSHIHEEAFICRHANGSLRNPYMTVHIFTLYCTAFDAANMKSSANLFVRSNAWLNCRDTIAARTRTHMQAQQQHNVLTGSAWHSPVYVPWSVVVPSCWGFSMASHWVCYQMPTEDNDAEHCRVCH